MNYYEHHLGDYAKDTAHLSMLEHGAYRMLLDRYYGTEVGIPESQAHRICRAKSRDEKAAVDAVLEEFFILEDGVWKNNRADSEIKKYADKRPKAEEKKENDKERQKRARERRKALFEELSGRGVHMPWNATTEELQAALVIATSQTCHAPVAEPVTRDNTATQTPDTSHQTPSKPKANNVDESTVVGEAKQKPAVALAMSLIAWEKSRGKFPKVNPADPRLQEWIEKGVTQESLRMAYEMAIADREAGGDGTAVNIGFLDVFLAQLLNPGPSKGSSIRKPTAAAPWFMTASGIEDKAKEIGIEKQSGEHFYVFRERVYSAVGVTEDMVRRAKIDAGERP